MVEAIARHFHQDIEEIKRDLALIKNILAEEYEFSDETKSSLAKARKTPRSEYISHEEVKKRLLK
ncbi:MAG TPA: hypothetical protein VJ044_09395 [Candidatus Hodarchaeales archaeon]|nr:hypothetical protein [Candidatus Hodarchaeales archaeon]HLC84286.1 hypothetical protein [Candidatus Nanoarchaeia archaeon]